MTRLLSIFFLFAVLVLGTSTSSFAEANGNLGAGGGYRSKYGFDIRAFKPNTSTGVGWLGGIRTGRFIGTSEVHLTLNVHFGTPSGGDPAREQLYYGGLGIGYDFRLSKVFVAEFGIIVGYGFGKSQQQNQRQTSYYVGEPSMGMGFALGNGWRLLFAASYIHMTRGQDFSGGTFGIRIDFKTQTITKDIND